VHGYKKITPFTSRQCAIDFQLSFGNVAAMAQTKTALLSLSVLILSSAAARAQTPPPIVETPYDIIEIGSIVGGKSGAKAPLLKYNTKKFEDPTALAAEANDLMVRLLVAAEAEQSKFAVINAVTPEELKGVKTVFERKLNGEWVVKGSQENTKVASEIASAYEKLDAAGKAMDIAAFQAHETPDYAHYLSNGTARTAAGDKEAAALIKAVAAYHTKVVAFFIHGDQITVVRERLWTGDYKPNPMAALRKASDATKSTDTWLIADGKIKLMRSLDSDEKITKL